MAVYVPEQFTEDEADILRRYFTNLDGPVFALVNLPEVVKGALFARYSRSPKSLRRLFLDEFVGDLDVSGDASIDATVGLERAAQDLAMGREELTPTRITQPTGEPRRAFDIGEQEGENAARQRFHLTCPRFSYRSLC